MALTKTHAGKQPNILFAIADDASHMSAYGHSFVHTPHFDRLAEEGVLFLHAFTPNPKCAPSRASILTGLYPWQLEEAGNHFGIFPSKFKVYPDLLEEAGYFVGYTGKGWGPGDWEKGGFSRNPAGNEYNDRKLEPPEQTGINRKDYAANFGDFLAHRPPGAPFCFWYGGHEPHRKYVEGEGARAGKRVEDVTVPAYLPDNEIVKNDLLDYAYEIEWFDKHLGLILQQLEDIGELDNTIIVATSDNGMPFPRVKGQMYEFDFRLPLAIRWKGENPGRQVEDLVSFVDFAPTFLEAAGIEVPPQIAGRSLVNLMESKSSGQVDPSRNRVYLGRERHDLGREGDVGYPVRCIRTRTHLYIRNFEPGRWPAGNPETGYTNVDNSPTKSLIIEQHDQGLNDYYFNLAFAKRPEEELYNIIEDPLCLNNLAGEPEHQERKEALWNELKAKLEQTVDPRMFGKGDVFDTYEYTGKAPNSWAKYIKRQNDKFK